MPSCKSHVLGHSRQLRSYEVRHATLGISGHGRKTNRIDAELLARAVVHLPGCATMHFATHLRKAKLPRSFHGLIAPMVNVLETTDSELARVEIDIQRVVEQEPKVKLLMTIAHVSVIVAAVFVSRIDEAGRFRNAHPVGAYLGLGPIRKELGRSALAMGCCVGATQRKFIAAVALARRLAGIMWAMWRDDGTYRAAHVGARSAGGLAQQAEDVSARARAMASAVQKASDVYALTSAALART